MTQETDDYLTGQIEHYRSYIQSLEESLDDARQCLEDLLAEEQDRRDGLR